MSANTDRNFVLQQGFDTAAAGRCTQMTSALLFQPRIVLPVAAIGTLLQSRDVFAVLAVVLVWSVLLPRFNVFDMIYNATFGRRPGAERLTRTPAPRRFAQFLAASFAVAITWAMGSGHTTTAWVLQAFLLVAATAVGVFKFCLGSFLFHLARGQAAYAVGTLPWAKPRG